jgi:hypothetical protein
LKEADIPHRTKIWKEILERAKKAEEHVRAHLQGVKGLVLFTFDMWTSGSLDPYLSVTSHYISAPADRPNDWELMSDQLAFTHIEGSHSGANLSHILVCTVDRYDLRQKVSAAATHLHIMLTIHVDRLVYS